MNTIIAVLSLDCAKGEITANTVASPYTLDDSEHTPHGTRRRCVERDGDRLRRDAADTAHRAKAPPEGEPLLHEVPRPALTDARRCSIDRRCWRISRSCFS